MKSLLVVGSLHWDIVVNAPHIPGCDETVLGHSVNYVFGGKGGNGFCRILDKRQAKLYLLIFSIRVVRWRFKRRADWDTLPLDSSSAFIMRLRSISAK